MKNISRLTMNIFLGLALTIACVVAAQAQEREPYTISAKAGGINFISGEATLRRNGEEKWQRLTSSDDLESGDAVRTGADGRVEVLLTPGSYLRAAENTEFELMNNSLDSLRIRLVRGNAMVEVSGADEARVAIQVDTPQARVNMDRKGLYRINALPGDATEVLVRKGEVIVGGDAAKSAKVKDGKKVVVSDGNAVVTKFDKDNQDTFDLWGKQRTETLIAVNRGLSKQTIANSLTSFRGSRWGQFAGYNSFSGLWIYDPFYRCRTFLPFYSGWSSPYGHSYSHGFGFSWNAHRHNAWNMPARPGSTSGRFPVGTGGRQPSPRRDDLGRQPHTKSAHRAPSHAPSHSSGHRRGRH